jgi:hypothetical protein
LMSTTMASEVAIVQWLASKSKALLSPRACITTET